MLLLKMQMILMANFHLITCNDAILPLLKLNEAALGDRGECSAQAETDSLILQDDGSPDGKYTVYLGDVVTTSSTPEPMKRLNAILCNFLYGYKTEGDEDADFSNNDTNNITMKPSEKKLLQFPTGREMHSELFRNKSGVHLPSPDLLHTEHCRLRVTDDHMQTAVDAFAIILDGSLTDVLALPGEYVLRSARTIAIMKIPQEKLAAMWDVVLNRRKPDEISYETLELYRPLFKFLNGRQMARLNLSNSRIVNYIGTHPELNRHQVGVVANKYIKINPDWKQAKYLNNMNNLLCGVPMSFMRKIDGSEYLRLEHQVFYHVRACDPLQRRFYLNMMTRTQALGKSFSWSARDVSRLGLLLAEVDGPALASISPEAMSGITAHVMAELKPKHLRHITEMQMRYIKAKPKNILARKLKLYEASMADAASRYMASAPLSLPLLALYYLLLIKQ